MPPPKRKAVSRSVSEKPRSRSPGRMGRAEKNRAISPESMPQRDESGGFSSAPDGMPPLPSEPAPMMPPEGDAAGSAGGANAGAAISGAMEPEKSEKPRKKSKWDQTGPGGLPEWLADLAPKEPRAPPGVAADRFKVLKMEAVQIRALIGRGGETIQEIRRNSGSEVKIDHQPSEPVGTVTIIGDLVKTEQMIMDALSAKGCPIGGPPARGGGGGPGVANPGVPREIAIPHDLVGGLIGPGGATINDIRQKAGSQVNISVLQANAPGGPQVCRITGPEELLNVAEEMITAKVNDLMEHRGGGRRRPFSEFSPIPVGQFTPSPTAPVALELKGPDGVGIVPIPVPAPALQGRGPGFLGGARIVPPPEAATKTSRPSRPTMFDAINAAKGVMPKPPGFGPPGCGDGGCEGGFDGGFGCDGGCGYDGSFDAGCGSCGSSGCGGCGGCGCGDFGCGGCDGSCGAACGGCCGCGYGGDDWSQGGWDDGSGWDPSWGCGCDPWGGKGW